jgi:hypothetical protein
MARAVGLTGLGSVVTGTLTILAVKGVAASLISLSVVTLSGGIALIVGGAALLGYVLYRWYVLGDASAPGADKLSSQVVTSLQDKELGDAFDFLRNKGAVITLPLNAARNAIALRLQGLASIKAEQGEVGTIVNLAPEDDEHQGNLGIEYSFTNYCLYLTCKNGQLMFYFHSLAAAVTAFSQAEMS